MNFQEYQKLAMVTDLTNKLPDDCSPMAYFGLKLSGEASEVSELIGKAFRDDRGIFWKDRKEAIEEELGDVLWYIAAICKHLKLDMDKVAINNLEKLASRLLKGKLKGGGNDR